jgi:hypothetical protein
MNRVIALIIPLMVLVATTMTVVTLEVQREPDWQRELEAYIEARAMTETLTVQAVAEAQKPWNFVPRMGIPALNVSTWATAEKLPYPPREVQCALLAQQDPRTELETPDDSVPVERRIVYLGYHSDTLWNVGWLIHEGPREPFSAEVRAHLAAIGCDLPLE